MIIKRIDEKGNEKEYTSIKLAVKDLNLKIEDWKAELFIADALNRCGKAYKFKWEKVK